MRLAPLDHGHTPIVKAFLGLAQKMSGSPAPDVVKTLVYRLEYFGMAWSDLTQEIMRGDSDWSIGERELFAAFTSSLNRCKF